MKPAASKPSLFSRLRAGAARALLDLVDDNAGAAGERRRRIRPIERKAPDALVSPYKRQLAVAAARGETMNNADATGFDRALRVHAIGPMGKPFFRANAEDKWYAEAETFFKDWARHADFMSGFSWRECLQNAVSTISFEGDFVCVFDDGILSGGKGTGKFAFFGPDRIVPLDDTDFETWKKANGREGWTQTSGVLFDKLGRRAGVVVAAGLGQQTVKLADAFVLVLDPADPDAATWCHVSRPRRFGQVRTVPDAVAALPALIDAKEVREAHSATTKVNASRHGILKHDFTGWRDQGDLDAEIDDEEDAVAGEGAEGAEGEGAADDAPPPVPQFQGLSSVQRGNSVGAVDVIDKNDEFIVTPQLTPNPNIVGYLEDENRYAGRALGLPSLLATMRADHSYSGARAEIALAWDRFKDAQQFLEDHFSDWAACVLFRWAMATGRLSDEAPAGWERSLAWQYPRIPFLDPEKEATAGVALYRAGLATMEDLGIRREEVFSSMAADKACADKHGVTNCSLFEAAPGTASNLGGGDPAEDLSDRKDPDQ